MTLTLKCARCGHDLPPMDEDAEKLLTSVRGAVIQHPPGQCPDQLAATAASTASAPRVRTFEARTQIVETTGGAEHVLTAFASATAAPSAVAAMEPLGELANGLGLAWQGAAEHIGLADVPLADGMVDHAPAPIVVDQP